jgi:hypothetical protein
MKPVAVAEISEPGKIDTRSERSVILKTECSSYT